MKKMSELSPQEFLALKPGDQVSSTPTRAAEFRSYTIDGCSILGSYPSAVIMSGLRYEPQNVTTLSTVTGMVGGALQMSSQMVTATPIPLEEFQIRMAPDVAGDLAIAIITNLSVGAREIIRQKIADAPQIMSLINDNAV